MLPVVPLNTSDTIVFVGDSITDAEKCEVTYDQLLLEAKKPSDCQIVLPAPQKQFDKQIAEVLPERCLQDRVHLYQWAHAWSARCWLEETDLQDRCHDQKFFSCRK